MKVQIVVTEDNGSEFLRGEWNVVSMEISRDAPPEIEADYGIAQSFLTNAPCNLTITTEGKP